ncbi:hypothetical protein Tco_1010667, partial [Tanacetum coccineum]
ACDSSPNPKYWYLPTAFEKQIQHIKESCARYKWAKLKADDSVECDLGDVEQFFVPVLRDSHLTVRWAD